MGQLSGPARTSTPRERTRRTRPPMTIFLAALAILGVALGLLDWRAGVIACVPVGFLADPMRKLVPGEPVILVIVVGIVFGGALVGFFGKCGGRLPFSHIPIWR